MSIIAPHAYATRTKLVQSMILLMRKLFSPHKYWVTIYMIVVIRLVTISKLHLNFPTIKVKILKEQHMGFAAKKVGECIWERNGSSIFIFF